MIDWSQFNLNQYKRFSMQRMYSSQCDGHVPIVESDRQRRLEYSAGYPLRIWGLRFPLSEPQSVLSLSKRSKQRLHAQHIQGSGISHMSASKWEAQYNKSQMSWSTTLPMSTLTWVGSNRTDQEYLQCGCGKGAGGQVKHLVVQEEEGVMKTRGLTGQEVDRYIRTDWLYVSAGPTHQPTQTVYTRSTTVYTHERNYVSVVFWRCIV